MGPTIAAQTASPPPGFGPDAIGAYAPDLVRVGWFAAGVATVVLVGWFVLAPLLARVVRRRNRANPTLVEAVTRYFRVFVLLVGVFAGAAVAGYGEFVGNSALVVAAATIAVGVAGQRVFGSLVSGLALVWDPEVNVGNYIEWSDGEGVIRSITLRVTRVQTPDGELLTVPNTTLTDEAITRPYGRGRQRVVETLGVPYDADLDAVLADLEAAAASLDGVLGAPAPTGYVEALGGDAVEVRVHYWIEDPRNRGVLDVRSAFARAAKRRLEAADVAINPPTKRDIQGDLGVDLAGEPT